MLDRVALLAAGVDVLLYWRVAIGLLIGLAGALILDSVLAPGGMKVFAVVIAVVLPLAVCLVWQLRALARRGQSAS